MRNCCIVLFIFALLYNVSGRAQHLSPSSANVNQVRTPRNNGLSPVLSQYLMLKLNTDQNGRVTIDTVSYLYNEYIAKLDYLNNDSVPMRYIASDPDYYRLFIPLVYYRSPIAHYSKIAWRPRDMEKSPDPTKELLPFDETRFTKFKRAKETVDKALVDLYINRPELVVTTEDRVMRRSVRYDYMKVRDAAPKTPILTLFKPEKVAGVGYSPDRLIRRPNWWITGGSGSLQITQNYISDNWYKGGESSNSVLAYLKLFANYNDRERLQFENLFEAKLGFNTVPSDTLREYRVNTDMFRFYSKLGVQAAKYWYYTVSAEINSQFSRNYQKNSTTLVSTFLAPANFAFNIGMDFKLKKKKIDMSVFVSPGAYNFRYVGNREVDETKFGLKEGRRVLHDVGSKMTTTLACQIIPSVTLNSRLYYFTNYKKVEAEWENTFNFVLNRYLSTKLFVHARFDDGAKRVGDKGYFQLQELLSFGINYAW